MKRISGFFDRYAGPIYLFPAVLVAVLLLCYPIMSSVYFGMTDRSLLDSSYDMVGFDNFVNILSDSTFWVAFKNSVVWTVSSVLLQVLLGFIAALLLNRIRRFKGLFRTLLIIPWAFPAIVIAFSWSWLLNDMYGFVNAFLLKTGIIDQPILWLASPDKAMSSMVLINVWFGFPMMMVSILAALQSIPKDEYEAAAIDGASAWQSFYHITLRHVRLVIGLLVVLRTIWVFNNFELIFLVTGGGPGTATETLPLYSYRAGWVLNSLGKASAVATLLLVFLLAVSYVYFKILDKWERSDT